MSHSLGLSPGPASLKNGRGVTWWLLSTIVAVAVAVITYTATITMAYRDVTTDLALIRQELDLRREMFEAKDEALGARIAVLEGERDELRRLAGELSVTLRRLRENGHGNGR